MNVTFHSSGAISHAHYALVRKVESAESPQAADEAIRAEILAIRERLSKASPSSEKCKECLVILLYCFDAMESLDDIAGHFDFALIHAVNLAVSGRTLEARRIGYVFCSTLMPREHELNLMLVNGLRRVVIELESQAEGRICLALAALIEAPSADVIPAVQPTLMSLMNHASTRVRRRTLLALRALFQIDPERCLSQPKLLVERLLKRIREDKEPFVVEAALGLALDLFRNNLIAPNELSRLVANLIAEESGNAHSCAPLFIKALGVFGELVSVTPLSTQTDVLGSILQKLQTSSCMAAPNHASVIQSFRLFKDISPSTLAPSFSSAHHPLRLIIPLLSSPLPNLQYLFLSCLAQLDPALWVGENGEDILAERDVARIMSSTESPDDHIRILTIQILHRADPSIPRKLYENLLSAPIAPTLSSREKHATRLLEVIDAITDVGSAYAEALKDIIAAVEPGNPARTEQRFGNNDDAFLLEGVVNSVLLRTQSAIQEFQKSFVDALFQITLLAEKPCGPTLTLVTSAIACEFGAFSDMTPVDIARGLCRCLEHSSVSIQEAILLALLRVTALCETRPPEVLDRVNQLGAKSRRHIRTRCNQYIALTEKMANLKALIPPNSPLTLPDILQIIVTQPAPPKPNNTYPNSPSQSTPDTPKSKLRYHAYDEAPRVEFRQRRDPSHRQSIASHSPKHSSEQNLLTSPNASMRRLSLATERGHQPATELAKRRKEAAELSLKMDLISLDSPLAADQTSFSSQPMVVQQPSQREFDAAWVSLKTAGANARGWCMYSPKEAARRLEELGFSVFKESARQAQATDEILLLLHAAGADHGGVVQLRIGDDETCLWQLRTQSTTLRDQVKERLDRA
ncbi:hypothetical protein BOTBODRAFT_181025 [Botryobasidium botryosum FD-172 SS1]|uniref:Clathrin/coatomer adaptor adaptin-like N-terminal domain-containing protein n=1 Tax=Botryobasidium botryosum (strain FD-172 SS1) TaxID=930990 RepID=A0A067LXI0_BOTB1|nr:hypothetical protein BOTBODRAFT_181025 [Botryobasidium botryosum FD-172 SS1]